MWKQNVEKAEFPFVIYPGGHRAPSSGMFIHVYTGLFMIILDNLHLFILLCEIMALFFDYHAYIQILLSL